MFLEVNPPFSITIKLKKNCHQGFIKRILLKSQQDFPPHKGVSLKAKNRTTLWGSDILCVFLCFLRSFYHENKSGFYCLQTGSMF